MAGSYWFSDVNVTSNKKLIEVDKGSPTTAKYAIFYAVDEDPVIFCKSYEVARKEIKKLREREDVQKKSIRLFKLINTVK